MGNGMGNGWGEEETLKNEKFSATITPTFWEEEWELKILLSTPSKSTPFSQRGEKKELKKYTELLCMFISLNKDIQFQAVDLLEDIYYL
jgi:hypothetical protein